MTTPPKRAEGGPGKGRGTAVFRPPPRPPPVPSGSHAVFGRWITASNMSHLSSVTVPTTPFHDQEAGTSGLRKPVRVFQTPNYTENFVQSILASISDLEGSSLVVGGDGRYFCKEAALTIIRMCAANGVKKVYVGQNAILSTPAASHLIRKYKTAGGILLTASHNPGGPDNDFGIKFNLANGGAAPSNVTDKIFATSSALKSYKIVKNLECPLDQIHDLMYKVDGKEFYVSIIDSTKDYVELMKEIFDFEKLRGLFRGANHQGPIDILIDCMHGVTGPYAKAIFEDELGAKKGSVIHNVPLEDFGGGHPDPNLTYAAELVSKLKKGQYEMGVAYDGDGDRNMILGKGAFFVSPSDSLAILAAHLHCIPYFTKNKITGFARSMPTAAAVDMVGKSKGIPVFETPTGWKYFCNLLDADLVCLCGEESFGTGSNHIREKDGIWASLAWLSVMAHLRAPIDTIVKEHWKKYGRNYTIRHDFENIEKDKADNLMKALETLVSADPGSLGIGDEVRKVQKADNFSYTDPTDNSMAKKQGIRLLFDDNSRILYRLSGTGSQGATLRVYIEAYEGDPEKVEYAREGILEPLVQMAYQVAKIAFYTGRERPTVIT